MANRLGFQALLKEIQDEKEREFQILEIDNVELQSKLFLEDILTIKLYEYGFEKQKAKRSTSVYLRQQHELSCEVHLPQVPYMDASGGMPIGFSLINKASNSVELRFEGGIPIVGLVAYSLSAYVKGDGSRDNPAIPVYSPKAHVVNAHALLGAFDQLARSISNFSC